jgi:DNA polymerase-3 subunit epsilon
MEIPASYNERVIIALSKLKSALPSFMVIDGGRNSAEKSCILIEEGQFYGMGYVSTDLIDQDITDLKKYLTPYASNDYIRNMVLNYSIRYPLKIRSNSTSISTEIPI